MPSGAELTITPAPWADARDLYQSVFEELKTAKLDPEAEIDVNFRKDMLCIALSSKKIEARVWKCMERCLYEGLKIDENTFEPDKAREDYLKVCLEVSQENIRPFVKALLSEFGPLFAAMTSSLE